MGEFDNIEPLDNGRSQVVTFKDRPTAELFYYGNREIESLGKVEMAWHNATKPPAPENANTTQQSPVAPTKAMDVDYDVAEEPEDRWS